MNKNTTLLIVAGIAAVFLADRAIVSFCKHQGGDWKGLLATGTPEEIESVEIWRNGVNAKSPEHVFTSNDDISTFLDSLRSATPFPQNHPQYDERFDVKIIRTSGSRHALRVRTGGSAGDGAVFYFSGGGGARSSKALADLLSVNNITGSPTNESTHIFHSSRCEKMVILTLCL